MSQGIFHVQFKANTQDFGEGLVIIKDGKVNGGDANYLYQGAVPTESGDFTAEINVTQWNAGNTHVFGGTGNYVLEARGNIDYQTGVLTLKGSPAGSPNLILQASGKRVADAV